MGECEVCGRAVSHTKRSEIDGVILEVCDNCSGLGKEMAEPKKLFVRKRPDFGTIDEGKDLVPDFADMVRKAREDRELSQDEAAGRIGIPASVLRRVENGMKPFESTTKKIQRFYGISLFEKD